jgi:hypothetical protein
VEVAAVIGFLLQMGFQKTMCPYDCGALPPAQQCTVVGLAQLGILHLYQVTNGMSSSGNILFV